MSSESNISRRDLLQNLSGITAVCAVEEVDTSSKCVLVVTLSSRLTSKEKYVISKKIKCFSNTLPDDFPPMMIVDE